MRTTITILLIGFIASVGRGEVRIIPVPEKSAAQPKEEILVTYYVVSRFAYALGGDSGQGFSGGVCCFGSVQTERAFRQLDSDTAGCS